MTGAAINRIYEHFRGEFETAVRERRERRVGAELKFPLVDAEGRAVRRATVDAFWEHLVRRGWIPDIDPTGGQVIGAHKPGPCNDTVASCETGYCKAEFSLAHAADLDELQAILHDVTADWHSFADRHEVHALCYGIQPVTPPSAELLMKKMRAGLWDKALPSNRVIAPEHGDDVHLFTINACSHVHVSTTPDEAVRAVNVLNGLAGAQISLTANSGVTGAWKHPPYKCVNEKLWDWWAPVQGRVGVPEAPFKNLRDYVARIGALQPIYVKREGGPVLLTEHYARFSDYFAANPATGRTIDGEEVTVIPTTEDVAVHNSCYWYTARISRYFTVENRVFDQQPRDALLAPAALTLGILSALPEAWEELSGHAWRLLRETREQACRHGLDWSIEGVTAAGLAGRMLDIAALGLDRRGRGEARFLAPLRSRLRNGACPADAVARWRRNDWPARLLKEHAL